MQLDKVKLETVQEALRFAGPVVWEGDSCDYSLDLSQRTFNEGNLKCVRQMVIKARDMPPINDASLTTTEASNHIQIHLIDTLAKWGALVSINGECTEIGWYSGEVHSDILENHEITNTNRLQALCDATIAIGKEREGK